MRQLIALLIAASLSTGSFATSVQPDIQTKRAELTKNDPAENKPPPPHFLIKQEITKAIANGITSANEKRDAAYPPPHNEKSFWDFLINGVLALVGVGQCYLIFHTLRATRDAANAAKKAADVAERTAKSMEDTAQRQLRAYVSVTTGQTLNEKGVLIPGRIDLPVDNRGQTPAYDLQVWWLIDIREYPLTKALPSGKDRISPKCVLFPGEGQRPIIGLPTISNEDVSEIIAGKKAIYIWGEVTYIDAFKTKQRTPFRFFQGSEGMKCRAFASYHNGNEAT